MNLYERLLSDGRRIDVIPLLQGRGRIVIGHPETQTYDEIW